MKLLRDDSGKELFGEEEGKAMEEQNEIGWADFPCFNHARNLHFDASNRNFSSFMKDTLGPKLEVRTLTLTLSLTLILTLINITLTLGRYPRSLRHVVAGE